MTRCDHCQHERFDDARETHDGHDASCPRGIELYAASYEAFIGFPCRTGHGSMHMMTAETGTRVCAAINVVSGYSATYYVHSRSVIVSVSQQVARWRLKNGANPYWELRQIADGRILSKTGTCLPGKLNNAVDYASIAP